MPKAKSTILAITTVSAALLLVAIPSLDSFAIGPPPQRPSLKTPAPKSRVGPPNKVPPRDANDHVSGGHVHPPHLHSKKCKDMYGNLVPCLASPFAQPESSR